MTRRRLLRQLLGIAASSVLVRAADCAAAEPPASQPDASWNEVGFTEDTLRDAWQQRVYQFKIGSPKWRLTVETENSSGSSNAHVRIAIEVETIRDFRKGTPANWGPFAHLYEGKPGGTGTKELQDGLQKDGSAKFFRLVISGVNVHYHVTVEDQSPSGGKKKGRKKGK